MNGIARLISRCFVMLAILLPGCIPTADWEIIPGPNGYPAAMISCRQSQAACYEAASRACPTGYNIIDSGGHNAGYIRTSQYTAMSVYRGELFIECKAKQ